MPDSRNTAEEGMKEYESWKMGRITLKCCLGTWHGSYTYELTVAMVT